MIPTKKQWQTLFFPFPLIVIGLFIYDGAGNANKLPLLFGVNLTIALSSWYVSVVANNYVSLWLGKPSQTFLRAVSLFLFHALAHSAIISVLFYVLSKTDSPGNYFRLENYNLIMLLAFGSNFVFCCIWQTDFIFNQWKSTLIVRGVMEKEYLKEEYYRLKKQINPNFLFNNFTILSSLISENPKKAIFFLDRLSSVYRYLLKNGEYGLSSVENEVNFLQDYAKLLEVRFGQAVRLNVHLEDVNWNFLIPALSLQLLIENAIKHNKCSLQQPLEIYIFKGINDGIIVSNNIQGKINPIASHESGLALLMSKYETFGFQKITIIKTTTQFSVYIPAINPSQNIESVALGDIPS